jgi:hypothetical protein
MFSHTILISKDPLISFGMSFGNIFHYYCMLTVKTHGTNLLSRGSSSFYFLASTISPNTPRTSITADKRATNTSIGGIVFDQCAVTPSAAGASVKGMTGSVFLGRPWNSFARVAYIKTYLDTCVNPAGWTQ